jgi:protein-S-isoprenylcysteine O-methyltransferase Ste14
MMKLWIALRAIAYATVFVTAFGWFALELRRYDDDLGGSLPLWLAIPGFILILAGAALIIACIAVFVTRGRGTQVPFDAPRVLVPSGPYRYVRNPMYIGMAAALAGFALVSRSPAMLVFSAVALAAFHAFVVLYEEPHLQRLFGPTYADYRAGVRRWIPRVPRGRDAGGRRREEGSASPSGRG